MPTQNPFPLEIVQKVNSPELLAFLQQFGHDKYADAEDINTIIQALQFIYENLGGAAISDLTKFTSRPLITIDELSVIVSDDGAWMVNGVSFAQTDGATFALSLSEEGKSRFVIIIADDTGEYRVLNGPESEINPPSPTLPLNTLLVSIILVNDNSAAEIPIGQFISTLEQKEYIITDEMGVGDEVIPFYTPNGTTYRIQGAGGVLSSTYKQSGAPFQGQEITISNETEADLLLKHLGSSNSNLIPFYFPTQSDYNCTANECLKFRYVNGVWQYVGIISVGGGGGSTPDATTTVKGIAQLATPAEGITGTNNTKIVTPLVLKAVTDALLDTGGAFLNALNDYQQFSQDFTDAEIATLKDGVATPGNTLQKLYNLILGASAEEAVANIAARDAYNIPHLPFSIFVTDDGDGRWAKYQATTTGVGATFEKISDPDLLNAVMNAAAIKIAYESNSDTNAFTNALLAKLNGIESVYQVILTATNLGAFTNALTSKTTPIANDVFLIRNSVTGDVEKVTYTNLSATLKAYFDTVYAGSGKTLKRILNNTVETSAVSGTTSETLLYSAPVISGGTFSNNDYFSFRATFRKQPQNEINCTYRFYVSNANNFATASLLATWVSLRFNPVIERNNIFFKANGTINTGISPTSSVQSDYNQNSDTGVTSLAVTPVNDIYLFVSVQFAAIVDNVRMTAIKITN